MKTFLLIIFYILSIINCVLLCNKQTFYSPESKYDCSGLEIDSLTEDKFCCFWKYTVDEKTINRCSSINDYQFNNLKEYIAKKREAYKDLEIKCTEDQKLYCNNILLEDEDCSKLKIADENDKYCCKWKYKDSLDNKNYEYCASISEKEFLNLTDYTNNLNNKEYSDLTIDCNYLDKTGESGFLKINSMIFGLLLLILNA